MVVSAAAGQVPDQLPDPDGKPADQSKPVKVFILMGQSNMLGFGRVDPEDKQGTLTHLTKKEGKYPHLVDDAGQLDGGRTSATSRDADDGRHTGQRNRG